MNYTFIRVLVFEVAYFDFTAIHLTFMAFTCLFLISKINLSTHTTQYKMYICKRNLRKLAILTTNNEYCKLVLTIYTVLIGAVFLPLVS